MSLIEGTKKRPTGLTVCRTESVCTLNVTNYNSLLLTYCCYGTAKVVQTNWKQKEKYLLHVEKAEIDTCFTELSTLDHRQEPLIIGNPTERKLGETPGEKGRNCRTVREKLPGSPDFSGRWNKLHRPLLLLSAGGENSFSGRWNPFLLCNFACISLLQRYKTKRKKPNETLIFFGFFFPCVPTTVSCRCKNGTAQRTFAVSWAANV